MKSTLLMVNGGFLGLLAAIAVSSLLDRLEAGRSFDAELLLAVAASVLAVVNIAAAFMEERAHVQQPN